MRIWDEVLSVTDSRALLIDHQLLRENLIMCAVKDATPLRLTIHCEILQRIMALKEDRTFLLRPRHFVKLASTKIRESELRWDVKMS